MQKHWKGLSLLAGIIAIGLIFLAAPWSGTAADNAAKPKTDTPEELAKLVLASVLSKDYKAFRALCATKEDVLAMAKGAASEVERKEMEDYANKYFTPELEAKLKAHFDFVLKQDDWKNVAAVKTVVEKPREREGRPPKIGSIDIHLDTTFKLRIKDSVKTPRGWVIGDDNPIYLVMPNGKTLFPPLPEDTAPPTPRAPSNKDVKGGNDTPAKDAPVKPGPGKDAPAKDGPVKDAPRKNTGTN